MDLSPSASLVASPPFEDFLALVEEQPNNIMVETQESVVGGNGCGDVLTEEEKYKIYSTLMKHIYKIISLLVAISAIWIGLLKTSVIPHNYALLLPLYLVVSLGCYGLLMVGVGLMQFPTCPQEAALLQMDIAEAKEFLKKKGVDVGSD